jgi:hypothetical protein
MTGYKSPPLHSRFQKGKCPNPRGRGKRRLLKAGDAIRNILNATVTFREGDKRKKKNRAALAIRHIGGLAMKGDIGAAATILKLRAHFEKYGDVNPSILVMSELDARV